jgi:hypothetical protein
MAWFVDARSGMAGMVRYGLLRQGMARLGYVWLAWFGMVV